MKRKRIADASRPSVSSLRPSGPSLARAPAFAGNAFGFDGPAARDADGGGGGGGGVGHEFGQVAIHASARKNEGDGAGAGPAKAVEPSQRIQDYLRHIRSSPRKIRGDSDADDIAREIVADKGVYGGLDMNDKAMLILEMLDGFTGDDDEQAIIEIIREVKGSGRLEELFALVPLSEIESDIDGEEATTLANLLRDVKKDAGPQATFDTCDTLEQRLALSARAKQAEAMVIRGHEAIKTARAQLGKTDETVQRAVLAHFKVQVGSPDAPALLDAVEQKFALIRQGFRSGFQFECHEGEGVPAEVTWVRAWSDVHIHPDFFTMSDPDAPVDAPASTHDEFRTKVLIHELAHKFAGCDDVATKEGRGREGQATEGGKKYFQLDASEAIRNADSYANFSRALS